MTVTFFKENESSKKFAKDLEVGTDDWLFHFTGRDETMPGLRVLFLDSIRYRDEKINDVDTDIWSIKLSFKREHWEHLYKNSGRFNMVFELMLYNKKNGRRREYDLFKMPTLSKDQTIYRICDSNIINENIYNVEVKVVDFDDTVNMCIRFKVSPY